MPTPIFILVILGVIFAFIGLIVVIGSRANRPPGPSKREQELENLVDELREVAYERRDTDASLSFEITDKIARFNKKGRQIG